MRAASLSLFAWLCACSLPPNLRAPDLRGSDALPATDAAMEASLDDVVAVPDVATCDPPELLSPLQGALYASSTVALRVRSRAPMIEVQRAAPPGFATEPIVAVAVTSGVAEAPLAHEPGERGRARLVRVRARCDNGATSPWISTAFRVGTRSATASGAAWRSDAIERVELDVNSDGRSELLATAGSNVLSVAAGQSMASATPALDWDGVVDGVAAVGDVHADGFGDVIAGQIARPDASGSVVLLRGAQDGSLRVAGRFSVAGASGLGRVISAAGDIDEDGRADWLVADAQRVFVIAARSLVVDGAVEPAARMAPSGLGAETIDAVVGGDFDGDGDLDVAVGVSATRASAGSVFVFERQASGFVQAAEHRGAATNARFGASLSAGALLNNGAMQLVVGAAGGVGASDPTGEVFVFANALTMQAPVALTVMAARDVTRADRFGAAVVVAGDGDGDGASEVAVLSPSRVTSSGRLGQLSLFEFEGGSTVRRATVIDPPSDVSGATFAGPLSACGTFTADGELCLAVAQPRDRGFGGFVFARSISASWMQTAASRTLSFSADGAASRIVARRGPAARSILSCRSLAARTL